MFAEWIANFGECFELPADSFHPLEPVQFLEWRGWQQVIRAEDNSCPRTEEEEAKS